ncbi:MAG TPA: hypothetical protein VG797_11805 [Phycisphaerales bacterium]|nr:hypothetical protein [Phycisphaerales bacterium]
MQAQGVCHIFIAFDVAQSIDLETVGRLLKEPAQREIIRAGPRAPAYFQIRPLPLRVARRTEPLEIAGFRTAPQVDVVLFDFGGVSVSYTIPLAAAAASLVPLAEALTDNKGLIAHARGHVESLIASLGPALRRPMLSEVVEDYVVFRLKPEPRPADADALVRDQAALFASILRCDPSPLSAQQREDAISSRVSYAPDDAVVIDWNAALVIAPDDAADTLAVLEFANVELMEVRHLDDRLDSDLDLAYEAASSPASFWSRVRGSRSMLQRRLARLQVDSAVLFEEVNNALKLIGDQHLARVYRLAAQRFHLSEWDASITRKLETLDNIHQKLVEERAGLRMEVLEWIIIILIAFEVVMAFFR